jgi:hypothetical protein
MQPPMNADGGFPSDRSSHHNVILRTSARRTGPEGKNRKAKVDELFLYPHCRGSAGSAF